MTLDELLENESGTILRINDEELGKHLLKMGFIVGGKIKVEKIAPLKDPMLIASEANYVSIRKLDAKNVEINKID